MPAYITNASHFAYLQMRAWKDPVLIKWCHYFFGETRDGTYLHNLPKTRQIAILLDSVFNRRFEFYAYIFTVYTREHKIQITSTAGERVQPLD